MRCAERELFIEITSNHPHIIIYQNDKNVCTIIVYPPNTCNNKNPLSHVPNITSTCKSVSVSANDTTYIITIVIHIVNETMSDYSIDFYNGTANMTTANMTTANMTTIPVNCE